MRSYQQTTASRSGATGRLQEGSKQKTEGRTVDSIPAGSGLAGFGSPFAYDPLKEGAPLLVPDHNSFSLFVWFQARVLVTQIGKKTSKQ